MSVKIESIFIVIVLIMLTIKCSFENKEMILSETNCNKVYINKDKKSIELQNLKLSFDEILVNQDNIESLDKYWIRLYKYKNKFYLYYPCDLINHIKIGINLKYVEVSNVENFKYPINSYKIEGNNININYLLPNNDEFKLNIIKIDSIKEIYEFNFLDENNKYYMTSIKNIDNFDLIINKCPNSKCPEFNFED